MSLTCFLIITISGNMGIEEELIDSDYPTFLVHIDTWNKMKTNFYDNQDGQHMMLATSEKQAEIGVCKYRSPRSGRTRVNDEYIVGKQK